MKQNVNTGGWITCLGCGWRIREPDFEEHRRARHGFTPGVYESADRTRRNSVATQDRTGAPRKKRRVAQQRPTAMAKRRNSRSREQNGTPIAVPNRYGFLGNVLVEQNGIVRRATPTEIRTLAAKVRVAENPPTIRRIRATFVSGGGGPGTGKRR